MKKLEIKPFEEFWLNCGFNNNSSILTPNDEVIGEISPVFMGISEHSI